MRYFFHLVTVITAVSIGAVRADDGTPATPTDFTYTVIYTALSNDGTPVHSDVKRVAVSGPHQRIDRFDGPSEIVDALTSRMVSIDSQHKTYTVHERQRVIDTADGSQAEVEIPKRPAHDYYKHLTWMPDDSKQIELPGETTINGHRARGVRVTRTTTDGTTETTCWTAIDTGRVIQVKSAMTPTGTHHHKLSSFGPPSITDRSLTNRSSQLCRRLDLK